jgi:hypothetical protein
VTALRKEDLLRKVIVRVKGGLGNQLFCYAAARRLALINDAELVIDNVTGFIRDRHYRREYMLDRFRIESRIATPSECLVPFERARRLVAKAWSRCLPFEKRPYLEQEGIEFDARLLQVRVSGALYMDGLWQGQGYFSDVEDTIRRDLQMPVPPDPTDQALGEAIRRDQGVAIHLRQFEPASSSSKYNLGSPYYRRAIEYMETHLQQPRYFVFSDDRSALLKLPPLPADRITTVVHAAGNDGTMADFWLMSQCSHFITANSTFSWWAAWLAGTRANSKVIVTPDVRLSGTAAWGFTGLIPSNWNRL